MKISPGHPGPFSGVNGLHKISANVYMLDDVELSAFLPDSRLLGKFSLVLIV